MKLLDLKKKFVKPEMDENGGGRFSKKINGGEGGAS